MAERDGDSIGGRVRRYARVGRAMGSVAVKAAGGRVMGQPFSSVVNAGELRDALGGLKGPLMKVAQILSTVPDLLPDDYARELMQLQSNAPSMGWPFVRRRMSGELGPDWMSRFGSFDREAVAAASLGQVHRATTVDGTPIACKLQYPDMSSAVEADLRQLKVVFSVYRRYDQAIDPSEIHAELAARLREELDYEREARHIDLYRDMLVSENGVHVPDVIDDLSTDRLLSMAWLDGKSILGVAERDIGDRNEVALNMFRAWYAPFYGYGIIHGDPHLGNYSVRDDLGINLLDFGCVRVFPPSFVGAVIDLYKALRDDDEALAVHAYETWGFTDLDREMIEILNQWARFLYGPLMADTVRPIQEEGGIVYGAKVASKVHADLRKTGGVKPPREFVLMDRAAIGLGSVFTHINAEVNWYRLFHDLIDGFDIDRLASNQAKALKRAGLSVPA
ncbi:MAG: AarF/ABC1/UbiB kinase family protein [Rhodospirillales bacterium]